MGATASEASQDLSSQRAADSDRRGAGHRPTPRFLAELRSHQEWCFSRPQFPLWPRRRTKGCHFQEPLASQSPEPESGMLTLCVPASGAMGPCARRAEAQGDARSGGQSCVDWLAACQALDPPQPPTPCLPLHRSLVIAGSCRLPRRQDTPSGRVVVAWAWRWGSIKAPVALATLASGHFGEKGREAADGG